MRWLDDALDGLILAGLIILLALVLSALAAPRARGAEAVVWCAIDPTTSLESNRPPACYLLKEQCRAAIAGTPASCQKRRA